MKILLLGSTGQVGWELNRTLLTLGDITALDYPQIDMANPPSIQTAIQETKPDLIINATAYTDVEKAELEPDLAQIVNGVGPGILAEEAKKIGAAFIHYSTDFVFDGTKGSPYTEGTSPTQSMFMGKRNWPEIKLFWKQKSLPSSSEPVGYIPIAGHAL